MGADRRWIRDRGSLASCAVLALAACASHTPGEQAQTTPSRYAGTCQLAGIEEVPAPADQHEDSVAMIVRYHFNEASASDSTPWSLRFQVARARAHDLQLHLQAHPNVVCSQDASGTKAVHIDVPPFQGQTGQPVP